MGEFEDDRKMSTLNPGIQFVSLKTVVGWDFRRTEVIK